MSKRDDGGTAFPVADQGQILDEGMTLRDWFAGQVASALTSATIRPKGAWQRLRYMVGKSCLYEACNDKDIARAAYKQADSMLKAREEE